MTDKKIEEIIDKKFETCWVDKRSAIAHVHKDRIEELKSELNTELQKAVEEAVEGFAYYLLKRRNKDEFWGLSEGEVEMAMIVAKQYLESEGKQMIEEKIGKKFYSPYFKQMIEVVEYVDDNNWTFKLENGEVYATKTPLSYFEEQSEK